MYTDTKSIDHAATNTVQSIQCWTRTFPLTYSVAESYLDLAIGGGCVMIESSISRDTNAI